MLSVEVALPNLPVDQEVFAVVSAVFFAIYVSSSQFVALELAYKKVEVTVSPKHDPYVGEVPAREDTCPGPSAFAAGWTASERPTFGSRCVSGHGFRHTGQAL